MQNDDKKIEEKARYARTRRRWLFTTLSLVAATTAFWLGWQLGGNTVPTLSAPFTAPGVGEIPLLSGTSGTFPRWADPFLVIILSLILYYVIQNDFWDELSDDKEKDSISFGFFLLIIEAIFLGIGAILSVPAVTSLGFFLGIVMISKFIFALGDETFSWAGMGRSFRTQVFLVFWNAIYLGIWNGFAFSLSAFLAYTGVLFLAVTLAPVIAAAMFSWLIGTVPKLFHRNSTVSVQSS